MSHPVLRPLTSDQRDAVQISAAALIVFFGSFLAWVWLPGPTWPGFQFGPQPLMAMTAWNGNLRLFGTNIPHYTVVMAGGALAILAWLRATQSWTAPPVWMFALAGYGFLDVLWLMFVALQGGRIGLGAFVVAGALAWILWIERRRFQHVPRGAPARSFDVPDPLPDVPGPPGIS